jgi:restriction system protein
VVLIDGDYLARLMLRFEVGVQVEATFVIKQIDEDFFN